MPGTSAGQLSPAHSATDRNARHRRQIRGVRTIDVGEEFGDRLRWCACRPSSTAWQTSGRWGSWRARPGTPKPARSSSRVQAESDCEQQLIAASRRPVYWSSANASGVNGNPM
jgi:hypothetical protein